MNNRASDEAKNLAHAAPRTLLSGTHFPRLILGLCLVIGGVVFSSSAPAANAQYGGDFSRPPNPKKDQKKTPEPGAPAQTPGAEPNLKEEGKKVFSAPGASSDAPALPGETGWALVLETYKGEQAAGLAQSRVGVVADMLKRDDVAVRTRDNGAAVVLGSYASPSDDKAQRDLKWVRAFQDQAGQRPYEGAFLAAPTSHDKGQSPEFDLGSARRALGSNRPLYTLQIAVYETPDKPEEAKRAAEQAAKVLRDSGEKAFYYHGPRRSMVTIGIFSDRDLDANTGRARSPEIARLKKAYPLNLLNGQYPIKTGKDTQQPSELVKVP